MLSRAAALTRGSGPTAAAAATTTSSTMFAGCAPWRRGLSCATSARPGWVRARNGRELHRRDLPAAALVAGVRGFSASARAAVSASSSSASGEEGASPSPPPPVFVVFGATGGIGEAVARQLHAVHAGAGIVISGRNESKLSSIAASLPGAVAVPADATDAKAVDAVIAAALKLGPISGVTSCVGRERARGGWVRIPPRRRTFFFPIYMTFNLFLHIQSFELLSESLCAGRIFPTCFTRSGSQRLARLDFFRLDTATRLTSTKNFGKGREKSGESWAMRIPYSAPALWRTDLNREVRFATC